MAGASPRPACRAQRLGLSMVPVQVLAPQRQAQIFFNRFTTDSETVFREFCLDHPNITYYFQEIGPCPVEIEIEVKSYARYHEILDQLRELSPGTVRNIHSIMLRNTRSSWNW